MQTSSLEALVACRNEELSKLHRQLEDSQFQQTLFMATYLTQNGVSVRDLTSGSNSSLVSKLEAQMRGGDLRL